MNIRKKVTSKNGSSQFRCLLTTVNNRTGIMVTGSLFSSNNAWTEFLPLDNPVAWERLGDLKQGRYNHGFEILGGKPTVFGGEYDRVVLNNFEQYDEITNEWTIVPDVTLPKPKSKFAYVKIWPVVIQDISLRHS